MVVLWIDGVDVSNLVTQYSAPELATRQIHTAPNGVMFSELNYRKREVRAMLEGVREPVYIALSASLTAKECAVKFLNTTDGQVHEGLFVPVFEAANVRYLDRGVPVYGGVKVELVEAVGI